MQRLHIPAAFAVASLLSAGTAGATAAPEDLLEAMELDRSWLVDGSVSTPNSSPTMFSVVQTLGVLTPNDPQTMALISTGNTKNITEGRDYDYPGTGADDSAGDHATLRFEVDVPEFANSFAFDFFFLSREYPEWVGEEFNDTFEVWLSSGAYNGQIVFDSAGNPVDVNNGLFTVVWDDDSGDEVLGETGFDRDGGTGWVTTVAPCVPGERLSLSFEIYDVADGIWDSAVLLDNFRFSIDEQKDPTSDHSPSGELELGYPSPKESELSGGGEVWLHGGGFDPDTTITWGDHALGSGTLEGAEVLIVPQVPTAEQAGVPGGGTIDITVTRGDDVVILADAFTYHASSEGEPRPFVTSVLPTSVHPDGETNIRVRGTGFRPGLRVLFVDADGNESVARFESLTATDDGSAVSAFSAAAVEGWATVLVENPGGTRSHPGYPIEVTTNAINTTYSDAAGGEGGSACGSSLLGGAAIGPVALMLLGSATLRRRREDVR